MYWASKGLAKRVREERFTTMHALRLTVLPFWSHLEHSEIRKRYRLLYEEACAKAETEREGKDSLGVEAVLAQQPEDSPKEFERKPQPWCHSTCMKLRRGYLETYASFSESYAEASKLFRAGFSAFFPDNAFPPRVPVGWEAMAQGPPEIR